MNLISVGEMALIYSDNLEDVKKQLTITSTGEKPFTLKLYKDHPYGLLVPRNYALRERLPIGNPFIPIKSEWLTNFKTNIILTPEQKQIEGDFIDAISTYSPLGGIIKATTGFGKTVLAIDLLGFFKLKTLIIVPTDRLMDQWRERLKTFSNLIDSEIGEIRQSKCHIGKVTIGMIHTLARRNPEHLKDEFGIVLWDEVHVLGAETFSQTASLFNCKYRIGLSATPRRKDGMANIFKWHIGEVLADYKKIPVKPIIKIINIVSPTSGHNGCIWNGKLILSRYLNKLARAQDRNKRIASGIEIMYKKNRNILVLSDRLQQLENIKRILITNKQMGKDIGMFTGESKQLDKKILLATYGSAGLGADIPRLDTLLFATPRVDIEQAVGRILRKLDGKKQPVVIDFVDTSSSIMRRWAELRMKFYKKIM